MNWQIAIDRTVAGMGYELVDAEKSAGGLLRVYIDRAPLVSHIAQPFVQERSITVDDCEVVTRQLQHVLEVENFSYERLEVSSPGLDRPLKKPADYARFVGQLVEVTLNSVFEGRKKYRGRLQERGSDWRLVLEPASARTGKPRKSAATVPGAQPELALDFSLNEVKEARLVPVVDFKGQRARMPQAAPEDTADRARPGSVEELDGGRIQ